MKYYKKLVAVVAVMILLVSGIGPAFAEGFSADIVSKSQGTVFQGRIYSTKDKTRMETPQAITITRMDKKIMWMLMPDQKMYMEMPLQPQNIVASDEKMPGEIERRTLGTEQVGGKLTTKYKIVYAPEGSPQMAILAWIANDLKFPVKTAAEDGSWVLEYKNINTASPDDSLFELPAGYQKLPYGMPMNMPGISDAEGE
jgi:hypothetical protein